MMKAKDISIGDLFLVDSRNQQYLAICLREPEDNKILGHIIGTKYKTKNFWEVRSDYVQEYEFDFKLCWLAIG